MNKSSAENDLDNKWNCFDENETLGQKDGREGRGWRDRWNAERGSDDIHIVAGLPNKNTDKFGLDDSALWAAIDDNIIPWWHHPEW